MEELTLFARKLRRMKRTTVQENSDMCICSHQTAAAYGVADLCSTIIGAVKVFINKIIIKKDFLVCGLSVDIEEWL